MSDSSTFTVDPKGPEVFTTKWIIIENLFACVSLIPAALLSKVLMDLSVSSLDTPLIVVTLGLAGSVLTFLFIAVMQMPFAIGNLWIRRRFNKEGAQVVQVTFSPRTSSGLKLALEDADDYGALTIREDEILFEGDFQTFLLKKKDIVGVETKNIGWRVFWLAGPATYLTVASSAGIFKSVRIHEREFLLMHHCRAMNFELSEKLIEFASSSKEQKPAA